MGTIIVGEAISCEISGCSVMLDSLECLHRHVLFHIYHVSSLLNTVHQLNEYLRASHASTCQVMQSAAVAATINVNMLQYDGNAFVCEWEQCMVCCCCCCYITNTCYYLHPVLFLLNNSRRLGDQAKQNKLLFFLFYLFFLFIPLLYVCLFC